MKWKEETQSEVERRDPEVIRYINNTFNLISDYEQMLIDSVLLNNDI